MNPEKRKKKERIKNLIKSNKMKNEAYIIIPNGKEAKNITGKMVDGKLQICYDLQDIFEPKDGDFIYREDINTYSVFICKYNDKNKERLGCHVSWQNVNGTIFWNINEDYYTDKRNCRFATEEEKSEFLERLEKECKKKWNADKKCLEDIYVPKFGDIVHVDLKDTDVYAPNKFCICIYPNVDKFEESNQFFNIANLGAYGDLAPTIGSHIKSISPASESEKKKLYEKLAQGGKKWNEEKKCLEDIYEPKFGDIVCIEYPDAEGYLRQYVISIFPDKEIPNKSESRFFDIAFIDMEGRLRIDSGAYYNHGYVREATIAEKQELFDKLKEVGKRFNPETKQIEDIRFMPHDGEQYWFITDFSEVVYTRYNSNNNADYFRATSNNCFKTEDAAKKVADQIKKIFKNSKAE